MHPDSKRFLESQEEAEQTVNIDHHPQCYKVREPGDPNAPCICEPSHVDGPPENCPANECCICAVIHCPHGEPLHYHHDGCPACAEVNVFAEQAPMGKVTCAHYDISRRSIPVDKGVAALLDTTHVDGWYCTVCGQRFAPINPGQKIVEA